MVDVLKEAVVVGDRVVALRAGEDHLGLVPEGVIGQEPGGARHGPLLGSRIQWVHQEHAQVVACTRGKKREDVTFYGEVTGRQGSECHILCG